ncbi:hypothetical protein [Clostridium butyricum]|uniref:Uncharacterized protein n=1 Tax=Clostridium butyricum TaxID=1492 RepID=A0AAP9UD02_CLOBU|nr:hypothetical protein [Clostridium butyricum]MBZ5745716.1 hypothetical protein [Clostridium butyricum]MDB2151774.1 hypothetical protein [Clostridium butyricum]MDI9210757.1 hypothetical protein [Clostridium butyricum]QMW89728.1 hypothetical protein FF104_01865 [Clostridium butyricum]BBK78209.1 hypothetical protein Cbu04g_32170 [Clostridium butyricum]
MKKNTNDVYGYIGNKLKNLWWPMAKYIIIFILLHNFFLNLNIYSDQIKGEMIFNSTYYTLYDILNYSFNTLFTMSYPVEMAGLCGLYYH